MELFLFVILISYLFQFENVSCHAHSPNIRQFGTSGGFDYGYVNLKAYPASKLNVTAYNTTITETREDCAMNCFMSQNYHPCMSVNIVETANQYENQTLYECHLLNTDRYISYPHFVNDTSDAVTHYEIDTLCSDPQPCPTKNHRCYPNHVTGEYACKCDHGFTGGDCTVRKAATEYEVTLGNSPLIYSKEVSSYPEELTISFWFKFEENIVQQSLCNIAIPDECRYLIVYLKRDQIDIKSGNDIKAKVEKRLQVGIWHRVLVTFDMRNGSTNIYINRFPKVNVQLKGQGNFTSDNISCVLGNSRQKFCRRFEPVNAYQKRTFKNLFAWPRILDNNDIDMSYQQEFIPSDYIISEEEMM